METMPKDLGMRKQWVKDRRRRKINEAKARKATMKAAEEEEIFDNVDRAWRKQGTTASKAMFGGFGDGIPGSTGTWVRRNGKLVRK